MTFKSFLFDWNWDGLGNFTVHLILLAIFISVVLFAVLNVHNLFRPKLTGGIVYKKEYNESEPSMYPIVTGQSVSMIPYTKPEEWLLHVRKWNEEKRKFQCDIFSVDEETYRNTRIGDKI